MSAHRGRPPCVTKEVGWFCGSRVEAAAAWPSSGVPPGGRRRVTCMTAGVRRCRSRPCCVFGLQGPFRPQELCAGFLPGHDAGRCGTGRRRGACGAGKPGGRAVSVTAPIPAVRGQAFSCPWLPGSRGARTCSGRRRPETCLAARIRWSAAFDSGRRRAVCKTVGSAYVGSNPTPATTCENGPLAGNSRLGGPFPSCHAVYRSVSLGVDVSRCPRTHSGRDSCPITVGAHRRLFHGRPRTGRAGGVSRA
jgi:hypothetical protein